MMSMLLMLVDVGKIERPVPQFLAGLRFCFRIADHS